MTTSENLPPQGSLPMELPLTSSAEGFPAKTSASPEKVKALMAAEAAYGQSSLDSFANFDPVTSSWRTSQHSLIEGLTVFSETWPRSGTMRSGTAFRLLPLVRLTDETEFGLWPTPHGMGEDGHGSELSMAARVSLGLSDSERSRRKTPLLPTPTAQQGGGSSRSGNRIGETPTLDGMARKGLLTNTAVDIPSATILTDVTTPTTAGSPETPNTRQKFIWPTPTAEDGESKGMSKKRLAEKGPDNLASAVKMWPTPTTRDAESLKKTMRGAGSKAKGNEWIPPLAVAVTLYPTPRKSDGNGSRELTPAGLRPDGKKTGLNDVTAWASPAARDFRSGRGRSENGHTPQLPEQVGGQLNPTWVEWLMGFPLKWTVVKD